MILSAPPETATVILFLAFSNCRTIILQSLFTLRNLRPFNSIVVKTPALPNNNFEFVPANRLFLFRLVEKQYLGDIINFQHVLGEPAENIMTFSGLYVADYMWRYLLEGDMGVYGIDLFLNGISVIWILMCGIAVSSNPGVCGFSSFWLTVFGKRGSFTVLRYCSFGLSFLM